MDFSARDGRLAVVAGVAGAAGACLSGALLYNLGHFAIRDNGSSVPDAAAAAAAPATAGSNKHETATAAAAATATAGAAVAAIDTQQPWLSGKLRAVQLYHYGSPRKSGRLVDLPDSARDRAITAAEVVQLLLAEGEDLQRWQAEVLSPDASRDGWIALESLAPERPLLVQLSGLVEVRLRLRPPPQQQQQQQQQQGADRRDDAFFTIGIFGGKTEQNHGTLWRSAFHTL